MLSGADRRTQRAQRPLADYAEQGGERQTKCSQESMRDNRESDSSSIFRSPQNDKLLNCSRLRSRLEYATGGNAERWREKMFGAAAACRDKHRRSAVRAEAPPCEGSQILAPQASAREHSHTTIKTDNCLRITKSQNDKKRRSNNRPQTTIPYQSFCTITPPADC